MASPESRWQNAIGRLDNDAVGLPIARIRTTRKSVERERETERERGREGGVDLQLQGLMSLGIEAGSLAMWQITEDRRLWYLIDDIVRLLVPQYKKRNSTQFTALRHHSANSTWLYESAD